MEGEYRVVIRFASKEVPGSPFYVNIKGAAGDPVKVTLSGPGADPAGNNCVGKRSFFNVHATSELFCTATTTIYY
ncbi:unnamed protein product [Protopolystoma xenopodis]|uniref:Uncharacterized protein n=1 Tax=Protopolystoma xenopodis TaxID=117903 RepID=A0A3S4ZMA0_9PLAT|nr:unnamed protein product [Protopolystoma xenopodis]